MSTLQLISLLLMVSFYLFAGVSHFRIPKFFLRITPPWVPSPELVNKLVGGIEIALALGLLLPATRTWAAYGVIALLIAVFPANIHHFQLARKKQKQLMMTAIRLPIQLLLIYWAYSFLG